MLEAKESSYAFVPYINYDTTQLWSLGGAFEKNSEDKAVDTYLIDLEATPHGNHHLETNYKTPLNNDWIIAFETNFSNFYDSYYGLGISTKVSEQKKIKQRLSSFSVKTLYEHAPDFSYGPFIAFNRRKEIPNFQMDNRRFFPDENSVSLGGIIVHDSRDSKVNPHSGNNYELTLNIVPEGMNNLQDVATFSQIKMDLRKYIPIYQTVLATRIAAGSTFGNPSYLYKYRLGGFDYLRGYQTNRFIGNRFAMIQLEERINLYQEYIFATASLETGTVTDKYIEKVRSSQGMGLRIAMPPDWTNLLSVNLGFGSDQSNFSMEFNENF
jgi:hypothetical protein